MPINTPETDIAIGAQEAARQGDFTSARLPSPGPLPFPKTAPIAVPGTGLTYENPNPEQNNEPAPGTNVDRTLLNKVLGIKDQPFKVGNLPTFTADEVYNPRYPNFLPGSNNEERFANAQPWTEKWGHALAKMGATAVGTFYNTLTALPQTIRSIGNGSNLYSSDSNNYVDEVMNNMENKWPNYYTDWEKAHPFMSAIPFSGGFANFWGDKMIKNFGFTIGAIAGAAVQDLAVGAVTEGIGAIPLMGTQVGRAALYLNKIFGSGKAIRQLGEAAEASGEALLAMNRLNLASKVNKLSDGVRYGLNLYGASAGEGGFEARDGYNTVKQDLLTAYQAEKGYMPSGKDLEDIETSARASANTRFAVNLALLSVSNAIQFDNLLKPWSVAKTGAKSTLEKNLGESGAIKLQAGQIDKFEAVKKGKFARLGNWSRPYAADILSEGVYEEGGQFAAQIGTQNYYERQYLAQHGLGIRGYKRSDDTSKFDSRDTINNILHSTVEGLKAEFGTDEGLENVFLGALTGIISKGAKAGYDRFISKSDPAEKNRNAVISDLNRIGVTGTLTNLYDSTVKAHRIAADMKAAVESNDLFKYKNYQHEKFVSFITDALRAGRFDVRMEQLELLKDMDQPAFKQAFGMDKTDAVVKTASQYVDLMKQKAQSIKNTYELINDTFVNPFIQRQGVTTDEQTIENKKHEIFNKWRDQLVFLGTIQDDVKNRQISINEEVKKLDPRIDMSVLRTLTNGKALKEYVATLQETADTLTESSNVKENPTKKLDAKEAKNLQSKIDRANAMLNQPTFSGKEYEKLFKDLLDHNINGYNPKAAPSPAYSIPPQSIPALIDYGRDSNRLNYYTEDAAKRFEALSSQDGIEKFYADFELGDQQYNTQQYNTYAKNNDINNLFKAPPPPTAERKETKTEETGTTEKPPEPAPIPKETLEVKSQDGKTSRVFEQGEFYVLDTGKDEKEPVQVIGQQPDGSVIVENREGEQTVIPIDKALEIDPLETELDEVIEENTSVDDNIPPTNEVNAETPKPESGLSSKDLSGARHTTTDPFYDRLDIQDNNFQRRHQNFLYNYGASDPKLFNQENRPKMRVMYVNARIATKLGFPQGWIDTEKYNTVDSESIRVIYVINEGKDTWYVGENGQKLGKILETKPNKDQIIYTNLISTRLNNSKGEPLYSNKKNLNPTEVMNEWRAERAAILAVNDLSHVPILSFKVSRGVPNTKDYNNRNSVVSTGLIGDADLDKPILSISTQETITPRGIEGGSSTLDSIYFKNGRVTLNSGLNVTWMNARTLTETEANDIFKLLQYIPVKKNKQELSTIITYLRGLINMATATESSILIKGMMLYLGTDPNGIFMSVHELEQNKTKIIDYLQTVYHNADRTKLNAIETSIKENRNLPVFTVPKIQDGNLVTARTFKNYNRYLLSDEGGRQDIPFTSNIAQTKDRKEGEVPLVGKYIKVQTVDNNSSQFKAAPAKETVIATSPTISVGSPKAQEQGIKPPVEVTDKDLVENLKNKSQLYPKLLNQETEVLYGDLVTDTDGNVTDLTPVGIKNPKTGVITKLTAQTTPIYKEFLLNVFAKSKITKDETNTPKPTPVEESPLEKAKRLKKEGTLQEKKSDKKYRTAFSFGTYEKADVDKEYDVFKHIVGDRYTLNKLDHLLRKTNGGYAWGAVQGNMLYIYNNAEVGTLYHEAFEAVWGNYLTGKEQQELYNEFLTRKGTFINDAGETVDFSKASLLEAKEQMAEDFRDYRINKDLASEALKTTPKLIQWFNNLINFIKKVIFGPKNETNKLFKRMNQGYYRNYSNNIRNIEDPQYSTARHWQLKGLPEYMIQDSLQGMTVLMMQRLFEEGSDVVDLLDERPKLAEKIIYDRLFEDFRNYYEGTSENSLLSDLLARVEEHPEDEAALNGQAEEILKQWENIKSKWDGFKAEHVRYLRVFKVEFKVDDEGETTREDDDETQEDGVDPEANKTQNEYTSNYLLADGKASASNTIKLMLASVADSIWKDATKSAIAATSVETVIKRDNSVVGLPKVAQYAKLFNYILHSAANVGNIYEAYKKLRDRVSDIDTRQVIDANVQRFLEKLNMAQGFFGRNWSQARVILKAEGAIVKNKPGYVRQFLDRFSDTYFKSSVLNSKTSQLKSDWVSGIQGSSIIVPGSADNPNFFQVDERVINNKGNVEFLNFIGIPISTSEYKRLSGYELEKFNRAVTGIRKTLEKAAKTKHPIEVISNQKGVDFDTRLTQLADVYINSISGDDTQSQHPNLDNEQTSSFVTNNFVITVLNDVNNSTSKEEFLQKIGNDYMRDIFHQDSYMLNYVMFDPETGKFRKHTGFTIVEGLETWNQNNRAASKLVEVQRAITEINNNNKGIFYTLLPADSTTENAIDIGTFVDPSNFFKGGVEGTKSEIDRYIDQMYNWLQTEIKLAKDFNTNKDRQNISILNEENPKDKSRKIGNSLRFFQDLLPKEMVDDIYKGIVDKKRGVKYQVNKDDFGRIIYQLVEERANNMMNYMVDWDMFQRLDENTVSVAGIDKKFLNTYIDETQFDTYDAEDIMKMLRFREMNYIISNIDMHKMFFGDPAQYKDELKRIKSFLSGRDYAHVDIYQGTPDANEGFNAWANEIMNKAGHKNDPNSQVALKPGDPGYKVYNNIMNTLTLEKVTSASDNNREDYQENDEADSQAWIIDNGYREIMMRSKGGWTDAQEAQHQRNQSWMRLDMENDDLYEYTDPNLRELDEKLLKEESDNKVAWQPLKLIHTGIQYVNGVAVSSIDKASWMNMSYRELKGRNLGHLYLELQKKGIDYVRMISAHKVGTQNKSLTSLYDNEGNFNKAGIQAAQAEQIQIKHLGIQVEQAKKEKGQTEGSQPRKIVTMDLMINGVARDFLYDKDGKAKFATKVDGEKAWNKLTEDKKQKASPIYKKVRRFDRAIANSVNIRTNNKMKELGIELEGDQYTIKNKTRLSKFILKELERRELPRNIAYGLGINPDTGDFELPLEANAQYAKIRQIIYSVIEATVQRPKFNGGQRTMVSVTGMESGPRIVKTMIKGKPVFTSALLKTYEKGKDGAKTTACEVMLPYYFEKKILEAQNLSKKRGEKVPLRTKEEILHYLNNTKEGKELLKGIGFRIPTQGLNSIDFFVIKDFLPENMGDIIVLPAEITKKAGSDFDIDKLNIYLKNFYVDRETGFPKMVTSSLLDNIDTNNEEQLRDYYETHLLAANREYKKYLKQYAAGELMTAVADKAGAKNDEYEEDEDNIPDYVPDLDEFILENKGKPAGEIANKELAENEYMDAMEDLLSDGLNYDALTKPNTADPLKGLRNTILALHEERAEDESKTQPYGKLLNSLFMLKERQAYLASKGIAGIAATSNTFHALSQGVQGSLIYYGREGFKIRAPHNEVDGNVSLSGLSLANHDDVYISNIISQIIDGAVDVTKDKFLFEMGITRDTLPVVLALVRAGVTPRWAITFINQPMIQQYLKNLAINDSVSIVSRRVNKENKKKVKLKTQIDSRFNQPNDRMIKQGPPATYSVSQMEDMIKSNNLSADQRALQWQMLQDFLNYTAMGWDLFNYYSGYNWDTANSGDPNMTRMKNLAYLRADGQVDDDRDKLPMTPVSKLVEHTFLGDMRKATWKLDNGFKSAIRVQRGAAGNLLTQFSKLLTKFYGANPKVKQQLALKYELSMVDYAIQNSSKETNVPIVDKISELLMGHFSTAHYIKALKKSSQKKLTENPFIRNLTSTPDIRDGWPSNVRLTERDYETYTSNVWTDAWRELKDDKTMISVSDDINDDKSVSQIFDMLVLTSILQYGGRRSSNSMTHLIPNEEYAKYAASALQLMNLRNFEEVGSFFRNNTNNEWLVPTIYEDTGNQGTQEKWYTFADTGNWARIYKEDKGEDAIPPRLLNLGNWNTKGREYVKRINPLTEKMELWQMVKTVGEDGPEPFVTVPERTVYKQINVWGSTRRKQEVIEHHQNVQPSILTGMNPYVNELSDDYILDLFERAGQITDPVNLTPEVNPSQAQTTPKFYPIKVDEVKRAGKKVFYNISNNEGETGEIQGYALSIPSHPDLKLYVSEIKPGKWSVSDDKTGKSVSARPSSTATAAIQAALTNINNVAQSLSLTPVNEEKLTKLGVKRSDISDKKSYQLTGSSETIPSRASRETIAIIKEFLNRLGVKLESVTGIVVDGKKIGSNGIADPMNRLVQVVGGKEDVALTEEAFHVAVELIEQKDPTLFKEMMNKIGRYNMYDKVLSEYKNTYVHPDGKPNIPRIKKEAIAKVLAEMFIRDNQEVIERPEFLDQTRTWWQKVLDALKKFFLRTGMNVFKEDPFDTAIGVVKDNQLTAKDLDNLTNEPYLQTRPSPDQIDYQFKAATKIFDNIKKVENWEKQIKDQDQLFKKIQNDLQIPKDQLQLIRDHYNGDIKEAVNAMVANLAYTVEIKRAEKAEYEDYRNLRSFTFNGNQYNVKEEVDFDEDGPSLYLVYSMNGKEIDLEDFVAASEAAGLSAKPDKIPTDTYKSVSVVGGTKYEERDIRIPGLGELVTTSHASFTKPNSIGWTRTDEKTPVNYYGVNEGKEFEYESDGKTTKNLIRRVLEIQSDLFQKNRENEMLLEASNRREIENFVERVGDRPSFTISTGPNGGFAVMSHSWDGVDYEDDFATVAEAQAYIDKRNRKFNDIENNEKPTPEYFQEQINQNKFLQLLNKEGNWIGFFVRVIMQDSLRNGYKTVRFPAGDTASKIEGHQTLASEIERIDAKIAKETDKLKKPILEKFNSINEKILNLQNKREADKYEYKKVNNGLGKISFDGRDVYNVFKGSNGYFSYSNIRTGGGIINTQYTQITPLLQELNVKDLGEGMSKENKQRKLDELLKQREELGKELENADIHLQEGLAHDIKRRELLKSEGIAKLKPIYNFYENRVKNILDKTYGKDNVIRVTDEHGNDWFELKTNSDRDRTIYFQKNDAGTLTEQLTRTNQNISKDEETGKFELNGNPIPNTVEKEVGKTESGRKSKYYEEKSADYIKAQRQFTKSTEGAIKTDINDIFNRLVDENGKIRIQELPKVLPSAINPHDNTFYNTLEVNMRERLHSYPKNDGGTTFFNDLNVYNEGRRIAGTIDFLAIKPDGKIDLLQFKAPEIKYSDTEVNRDKQVQYDKEIEELRTILENGYGVKREQFDKTRTIPIKADYSRVIPGDLRSPLSEITNLSIGGVNVKLIPDDLLIPIPSSSESTGNTKFDDLISKLRGLLRKTIDKKDPNISSAQKTLNIQNLFRAIKKLQVQRNANAVIASGKVLNKRLSEVYNRLEKIVENIDPATTTEDEMSFIGTEIMAERDEVEIYAEMSKAFRGIFTEDTEEDKDVIKRAREVSDDAEELSQKFEDLSVRHQTRNFATKVGIRDEFRPEKQLTWYRRMVRSLSQSHTTAGKLLYKLVENINNTFHIQFQERLDYLQDLKKNVDEWMKGRSLDDLNKKIFAFKDGKWTGTVIKQYDAQFYKDLREAQEKGNTRWVRENIDMDKYKAWFLEKHKQRIEEVKNGGPYHEDEEQNKRIIYSILSDFVNTYSPDARGFVNKFNNKLKDFPLDKHFSEGYKDLLKKENEPVFELYKYWNKRLHESIDNGMIDEHFGWSWFPNVRKNLIEKMTIGKAGGKLKDFFLGGIRLDAEDQDFGKLDPINKKPVNEVHANYVSDLAERVKMTDGRYFDDYSAKSMDIFKVLALWDKEMLKYDLKVQAEGLAKMLAFNEKNRGSLLKEKDPNTGKHVVDEDNNEANYKYLQQHIESVFYGKNTSNESDLKLTIPTKAIAEKINKFAGRTVMTVPEEEEITISGIKALGALNRFFVIKTLGVNVLSAVANFFGGTFNAYLNQGKFFDKTDLSKAELDLVSARFHGSEDAKKLAGFLAYIHPYVEDKTMDEVRKLSVSKAVRYFSSDHLFFMQRGSDKWVNQLIAIAFIKNAIVRDGKIQNIRQVAREELDHSKKYASGGEGAKAWNKALEARVEELRNSPESLLNMAKIENDKIEIAGLNLHDEKNIPQTVKEFRSQMLEFIKDALGNTSREDLSLYKTSILGQSVAMFKNWIPRMIDVRGQSLRYNVGTNQYEWGRMRMLFNAIQHSLRSSIKGLFQSLGGNDGTLIEIGKKLYIQKREEAEKQGESFDITEAEFIDMFLKGIVTQFKELGFALSLMGLMFAIRMRAPDYDEDPTLKGMYKWMVRGVDKLHDEVSFFYSPQSFNDILNGSIFPAANILVDATRLADAIALSGIYYLAGDDEKLQQQHPAKYVFRMMPITKEFLTYIAIFNNDIAKKYDLRVSSRNGSSR